MLFSTADESFICAFMFLLWHSNIHIVNLQLSLFQALISVEEKHCRERAEEESHGRDSDDKKTDSKGSYGEKRDDDSQDDRHPDHDHNSQDGHQDWDKQGGQGEDRKEQGGDSKDGKSWNPNKAEDSSGPDQASGCPISDGVYARLEARLKVSKNDWQIQGQVCRS